MLSTLEKHEPRLAVFASDRGRGDAERASIMTQAGNFLARRGARIVCVAGRGELPVPLIRAARAAGGEVTIIAASAIAVPPALGAVPLDVIEGQAEREARLASGVDAFVGLPGSLASATEFFSAWTAARKAGSTAPAVLLNRNRAYEVLRGFSADVLSHGLRDYDRTVQFADTIEDLWVRVTRLVYGD